MLGHCDHIFASDIRHYDLKTHEWVEADITAPWSACQRLICSSRRRKIA